jgi:hypothetical protein
MQDAYSEKLDLDVSDTSSQESIEGGEPEVHDYEEGTGKAHESKKGESGTRRPYGEIKRHQRGIEKADTPKEQQYDQVAANRTDQRSVSGDTC